MKAAAELRAWPNKRTFRETRQNHESERLQGRSGCPVKGRIFVFILLLTFDNCSSTSFRIIEPVQTH